jgi:pimeloyl-ACP methyl ester carboxylesterase
VDGQSKARDRQARFVDVPGGGHYLFMTKEAEVLREIHAFIVNLP